MSPREATLSLAGAFRLACFDNAGVHFFNATVQGFWNSYWVAAIVAPFHFLHVALIWHYGSEIPTPAFRYFSVEAIQYVMMWVAFPLVMVYVTRQFDRWDRFFTFGVANNWADLVISAVAIPVQIAVVTGLLTGTAMSLALSVVILYSLGLSWFIARHTLNISGLGASGVVTLSVFISFVIRYWAMLLISWGMVTT